MSINELYNIVVVMQRVRGLSQINLQESTKESSDNLKHYWKELEDKLDSNTPLLPDEFQDTKQTIRRDFSPDHGTSDPKLLFDIHTQMINRVNDIIRNLAFRSRLSTDVDVTVYNLKEIFLRYYPNLGESMGRLRAVVSIILASGEFGPTDQIRFGEVMGHVNRDLERTRGIHRFIREEVPFLQSVSGCFDRELEPNLLAVLDFSNTLMSEKTVKTDPLYFFLAVTYVIENNIVCHRQLHDKLHTILKTREGEARSQRLLTMSVSGVAILFMLGFMTDFYRRNRRAMLALTESREKVVQILEVVRDQRDKLAYEREIVEHTLEKINRSVKMSHAGATLLSVPLERIAGDFLLYAARPDGTRHYLLGDFTGHGLPSALGGPMVADIFYTMTRKNFAPPAILNEINAKLHLKLPRQLYLAAAFLAHDPNQGRLLIWNCGIPEILHFHQKEFYRSYPSNHLPLGILAEHELAKIEQSTTTNTMDRVYAFSDGFCEAQDAQGEMFGSANLQQALGELLLEDQPFQGVMEKIKRHRNGPQTDDLTMLELVFDGAGPPDPDTLLLINNFGKNCRKAND
ncbi:MAG: serine/threonine-protein phosphatase [Magnetococcales bacterium]|nr:serine/threonine-protein phosphatase [Magnetococcales bacterium]